MIEPINKAKNTMPLMPKGPNTTPRVTDRRINTKNIRNHFAHIWGHRSESGSGFDISTAMIVATNIAGAITTTAGSSSAPTTSIVPATNGEVTRAIAGYFHPRYIYKANTNIVIINIFNPKKKINSL